MPRRGQEVTIPEELAHELWALVTKPPNTPSRIAHRITARRLAHDQSAQTTDHKAIIRMLGPSKKYQTGEETRRASLESLREVAIVLGLDFDEMRSKLTAVPSRGQRLTPKERRALDLIRQIHATGEESEVDFAISLLQTTLESARKKAAKKAADDDSDPLDMNFD